MKSTKRPTLAILALVLCSMPVAHAAPDAPSAQSSAAAAPSGSANAAPTGMPISSYSWPREASEQPKEEEWAKATELEHVMTIVSTWWTKIPVKCLQRAVREWVRIECLPPNLVPEMLQQTPRYYGSLWAIAGDFSSVSSQFQTVSAIDALAQHINPNGASGRLVLGMGAIATITFQAKYGSAMMLRMDQIFWAEGYDGGGSVAVDPGIIIDLSWALGEKYPTIMLKG